LNQTAKLCDRDPLFISIFLAASASASAKSSCPSGLKQLKNGACAEVSSTGKYTIRKGAPASYMAQLRAKNTHTRKSISADQARRAFSRYYNRTGRFSPKSKHAYASAKRLASKSPVKMALARARDLRTNRSPKQLRDNTSYLQNPGRFEFKGVDYGLPGSTDTRRSVVSKKSAKKSPVVAKKSAKKSVKKASSTKSRK